TRTGARRIRPRATERPERNGPISRQCSAPRAKLSRGRGTGDEGAGAVSCACAVRRGVTEAPSSRYEIERVNVMIGRGWNSSLRPLQRVAEDGANARTAPALHNQVTAC